MVRILYNRSVPLRFKAKMKCGNFKELRRERDGPKIDWDNRIEKQQENFRFVEYITFNRNEGDYK